jgi:hypothetical protein
MTGEVSWYMSPIKTAVEALITEAPGILHEGMSAPHIDVYIVRVIEMSTHFLKMIYQLSYSKRYATK